MLGTEQIFGHVLVLIARYLNSFHFLKRHFPSVQDKNAKMLLCTHAMMM
jgi:hypothetical protein